MRNTEAVVAEARRWIGSPYVHQHRSRGHAVDCVGLVIGVGLAVDVLPTWSPEAWKPHGSYGRTPNPSHMKRAIAQFMTPLDIDPTASPPDGAVAFMAWREDLPMHLAIMATAPDGRRTMIHAFSGVGAVVEHGFAAEWPGRVDSFWAYPGIEEGS